MGEILMYFGLFIVSLAVLLWASDRFVDAAERIGLSFGVSPFVIGVTIIAFGTSLPELASSIAAVLINESEVVVGNVIGSNITNILLILGVVAVVSKEVRMNFRVMDLDIPLLVGSAFLLWFVLADQKVSFLECLLFLAALVVFLINSFKGGEEESEGERPTATWWHYFMMILGGALVYLGATYTIVAIQRISTLMEIDSEIIALTLVALGTSLPELVVSVTAAAKNKADIAVGNVLGSNIFNAYAVMAIPGLIGDLKIPDNILSFSLPFLVAITVLFSVSTITHKFTRWEGVMLLVFYAFFLLELLKTVI